MDAVLEIKKQNVQTGDEKSQAVVETLIVTILSGKPENQDDVAFRAFDDKNLLLYKSSRLGDIKTTDTGYSVEVSEDISLEGKTYELKNISTRKVIASGKITTQPTYATPAQVALPDGQEIAEKSKNKKEKTV